MTAQVECKPESAQGSEYPGVVSDRNELWETIRRRLHRHISEGDISGFLEGLRMRHSRPLNMGLV